MKLRNKKTGEIGFVYTGLNGEVKVCSEHDENHTCLGQYSSLSELNAEWEDVPEEPKGYWYIDDTGVIQIGQVLSSEINMRKSIGNYFGTKEEAEKAVEKLKAWKRLKDTYYIRFDLDFVKNTISFTYRIDGTLHSAVDAQRIVFEDMETIFGGENEHIFGK